MGHENYEETKRGIRRGTAIVVDVVFILFHKILTIMDVKNFNMDFEIPQNMQEELLGGKEWDWHLSFTLSSGMQCSEASGKDVDSDADTEKLTDLK